MSISTHVLDMTKGCPAAHVFVELDRDCAEGWTTLNAVQTDADGRVASLLPEDVAMEPGVYTIRFATGEYFKREGVNGLYPTVEITFAVRAGEPHYHVPLLLSANGYTTYRGS